ncbi:MAG: phosphate ABC transporter substrate-binding protein [Chloroflexota bacterium]
MWRPKHTLVMVTFALVSCSTPVAPASTPTHGAVTLRLYATTAAIPLLNDLTSHYIKNHPNVNFETATGNFQTMMQQLNNSGEGYLLSNHLPDDNSMLAWPIGQDGIALITHPKNPVDDLTSEQLRSVYLGHIARWSEVGGINSPLTILSREDGSSTRAEFEKLLLGERLTTQSAQVAPSSAAMVASVAQMPNSIGYVSMSYLDASVKALSIDGVMPTPATVYDNTYPLRSNLYVIGQTEPQNVYRDFVGWIQTPEGQQIVGLHYAPLPNVLHQGT